MVFLFTVRLPNNDPSDPPTALAYIRNMPVKKEQFRTSRDRDREVLAAMCSGRGTPGDRVKVFASATLYRLSKGINDGSHEVISVDDIVSLAGLIKGDDRSVYVVDKTGALWLDLAEEEASENRG